MDWSQHPPAPDGLSLEERAFVGIYPPPSRNGWRSAGEWARRLDLDPDTDPERVAMLRILVGLGDMTEEASP